MLVCKNNDERKEKIVDLYQNHYDKILEGKDGKFGYTPVVEALLNRTDPEFFVSLMKMKDNELFSTRGEEQEKITCTMLDTVLLFVHYKHILTNENFKDFRCQLIKTIKYYLLADSGYIKDG